MRVQMSSNSASLNCATQHQFQNVITQCTTYKLSYVFDYGVR